MRKLVWFIMGVLYDLHHRIMGLGCETYANHLGGLKFYGGLSQVR